MTASVNIIIGLSAVVFAVGDAGPEVLLGGEGTTLKQGPIDGSDNGGMGDQSGATQETIGSIRALGLPFGSFDPVGHRTFELAVRDFVTRQTGFKLGYVEQLYTFGDKGREAPIATVLDHEHSARVVSIGYLALTDESGAGNNRAGLWGNWYRFFPWEAPLSPQGKASLDALVPALTAWARDRETTDRVASAFGLGRAQWEETRVLERYELLYEAGLIVEAQRDRQLEGAIPSIAHTGEALVSDHRRILATAIGRLRAKIRYRPVIFDLAPAVFTLSGLQELVEQICGLALHKQNFRRMLEQSGLVEATNDVLHQTGGRPAKLFTRTYASSAFGAPGLSLPVLRR
jgi:hypothetical protein